MGLIMTNLVGLRVDKKLSMAQLGEILDIPEYEIDDIERDMGPFNMNTVRKLCDYFGCTVDYLLGVPALYDFPVSNTESKYIEAYNASSERDKKIVDTILKAYNKMSFIEAYRAASERDADIVDTVLKEYIVW